MGYEDFSWAAFIALRCARKVNEMAHIKVRTEHAQPALILPASWMEETVEMCVLGLLNLWRKINDVVRGGHKTGNYM